MKKIKKLIILLVLTSIVIVSCKLDEDPPYLSENSVYGNVEGTNAALNGILESYAAGFYYGNVYQQLTLFTSGMFISGKSSDRKDIAALNPYSSKNYVINFWRNAYFSIARANDLISHVDPDTDDEALKNILGIAYFLRAHSYFNLVRLYGGVPLRTEPSTGETLHMARASVQEVYDQIIADSEKAKTMMLDAGQQAGGRPGKYAANMMLAKVYMMLAGNDNGSLYWQKAYDEAIQVYGQYSLLADYADLWDDISTANNNVESIFEIQYNVENSGNLQKVFTNKSSYKGNDGWKRIRTNPEMIDMHMDRYSEDPRINLTFVATFIKYSNGKPVKGYPDVARGNFEKGFPYLYKYWVKDLEQASSKNDFNYMHYRYGDLLLMLAEIENELGNSAAAHGYVNEVLTRARNSGEGSVEPADWAGLGQDDFREAIMQEYRFELLGEGQDRFNNIRRGYEWFKTHSIDVHNARTEKGFDITYPDNSKIMLMPIPSVEINTNQLVSVDDQNPGY